MSCSDEEWKPVVGFESRYMVSNRGNLYSIRLRKVMSPQIHEGRYFKITLRTDTLKKKLFVHRIVAEAWIGERPVELRVNHKDGDRFNNAADNLEYVTESENLSHAWRMGLREKGRVQIQPPQKSLPSHLPTRRHKLSTEDINDIYALHNEVSIPALADLYGVSEKTVGRVLRKLRSKEGSAEICLIA